MKVTASPLLSHPEIASDALLHIVRRATGRPTLALSRAEAFELGGFLIGWVMGLLRAAGLSASDVRVLLLRLAEPSLQPPAINTRGGQA